MTPEDAAVVATAAGWILFGLSELIGMNPKIRASSVFQIGIMLMGAVFPYQLVRKDGRPIPPRSEDPPAMPRTRARQARRRTAGQ